MRLRHLNRKQNHSDKLVGLKACQLNICQMSRPDTKPATQGVRWDYKAFGIEWPISDIILFEKDKSYSYWK